VRVNSRLLAQRVPMALKAVKYSTWVAGIAAAAAGRPHNLSARVLGEARVQVEFLKWEWVQSVRGRVYEV
jgi:hypothetical protein